MRGVHRMIGGGVLVEVFVPGGLACAAWAISPSLLAVDSFSVCWVSGELMHLFVCLFVCCFIFVPDVVRV